MKKILPIIILAATLLGCSFGSFKTSNVKKKSYHNQITYKQFQTLLVNSPYRLIDKTKSFIYTLYRGSSDSLEKYNYLEEYKYDSRNKILLHKIDEVRKNSYEDYKMQSTEYYQYKDNDLYYINLENKTAILQGTGNKHLIENFIPFAMPLEEPKVMPPFKDTVSLENDGIFYSDNNDQLLTVVLNFTWKETEFSEFWQYDLKNKTQFYEYGDSINTWSIKYTNINIQPLNLNKYL